MKRSRCKSAVNAAKTDSVAKPLAEVTKRPRQDAQKPEVPGQHLSSVGRVNRPQRRMTAAQALVALQNLPETVSGSESDGSDADNEDDVIIAANDNSDSDSGNENESDGPPEHAYSGDEHKDNCKNGTSPKSKDGTVWKQITKIEPPGRIQQQKVFKAKVGLTNYCRAVATPLDALRLLVDDGMLRHIKTCTQTFAQLSQPNWKITDSELDAFIGLLYLRGAKDSNNFPLKMLWSEEYGCNAFGKTMARNRFCEIKKYIRFDLRSTRSERIKEDKFCMMSFVLNRFAETSQKSFAPAESLTVDEQLFPTKSRCRFTQYMPNKPDKFGIKFWILADLETKYCLNIIPYLGKDETRVDSLGTHVVMQLMEPYLGLGYNVTMDNFFTNRMLAEKLLEKRTSVVGTIRANRREIPPLVKLPLHDSVFYSSSSLNLTVYQAKQNKSVLILSTLHRGAAREGDGKKKPEAVLYYNCNKCGVDMLDYMCREMSTKAACRRWPLAVFFNVLDLAGVNAWIIYKTKTGSKISRRKFLFQLSQQLRESEVSRKAAEVVDVCPASGKFMKRVTCEVRANCKRNRTTTKCTECKRPVCGQCLAAVCIRCKSA